MICFLAKVESRHSKPLTIKVELDEVTVCMEVYTGAAMTLVYESTFKRLWPDRLLQLSTIKFRTYLGETLCCWFCYGVCLSWY